MAEKDFFQLIVKSISRISGINNALVKATAASASEIHFTKLETLPEEEVSKFVEKCLLVCGTDEKLLNFQVKKLGSKDRFEGIDIPLVFDNAEQKEKYLEYRNQLLAGNVISVQLYKNVECIYVFYL